MLARTYGPKYDRWPCYVQPKLNGIRCLYQDGLFQSRDEKLWHPSVLAHLRDDLAQIETGGMILDGELYVHGWRLQRINGAIAVNRNAPRDDTHLVEYHVFDIVNRGVCFSDRWLSVRYALVESALEHVKMVTTDYASTREQVQQHFHRYTSMGYEGIMLRPDGPYEPGRTPHGTEKRSEYLWKYKQWEDGEFWCVGATEGEGKADIGIGALILARQQNVPWIMINAQDYHASFKVGTGFDDAERIEFARNPPIGRLVKVRYLELTADGIPFNPSFLAVL